MEPLCYILETNAILSISYTSIKEISCQHFKIREISQSIKYTTKISLGYQKFVHAGPSFLPDINLLELSGGCLLQMRPLLPNSLKIPLPCLLLGLLCSFTLPPRPHSLGDIQLKNSNTNYQSISVRHIIVLHLCALVVPIN